MPKQARKAASSSSLQRMGVRTVGVACRSFFLPGVCDRPSPPPPPAPTAAALRAPSPASPPRRAAAAAPGAAPSAGSHGSDIIFLGTRGDARFPGTAETSGAEIAATAARVPPLPAPSPAPSAAPSPPPSTSPIDGRGEGDGCHVADLRCNLSALPFEPSSSAEKPLLRSSSKMVWFSVVWCGDRRLFSSQREKMTLPLPVFR
mmetsp:Transcript_53428/g.173826  ORF Transcript_53428/g.173826 Transcript_53428/m.173826 type:complete len:203 (-) Transcript_53428:395-1003(-)